MLNGQRVYDKDGLLAMELQQTVRCGDPWNEGIVWPRLAEISLLGGLGCGRVLLSLVIERLETAKATSNQNYDYAVLQATENSVPFYESMGFIRVGALTIDEQFMNSREKSSKHELDLTSKTDAPQEEVLRESNSSSNSVSSSSDIVSSPVDVYTVTKAGETPAEIAKKFNIPVWDIIFLNHYTFPDLNSRSRLMKETTLFLPSAVASKADARSLATTIKDLEGESSAPRWYIANENDTPKMIANKFGINCKDLVKANNERLPELLALSRLKAGTRVRVSHFHLHEDEHVPYCHWTFPDDSFESGDPSYMMARKLHRRMGVAANDRPVQSSLAVKVMKNVRPPSSLFHIANATPRKTPKSAKKKKSKTSLLPSIELPSKPKRPLSSYVLFCNEYRESLKEELAGKPGSEYTKVLSALWKELNDEAKAVYVEKHESAKREYRIAVAEYEKDLAEFHEKYPELKPTLASDDDQDDDGASSKGEDSLFNKVVTLNYSGPLLDSHREFKYFYVLTYIPDLQWCHLVPMRSVGTWGPDKPKCGGRPIWMLVNEKEGKEIDISSTFCRAVKSRGLRHTVDADKEQWDIPGSVEIQESHANNLETMTSANIVIYSMDNDLEIKASARDVPLPHQEEISTIMKSASKTKKRKRVSDVSSSKKSLTAETLKRRIMHSNGSDQNNCKILVEAISTEQKGLKAGLLDLGAVEGQRLIESLEIKYGTGGKPIEKCMDQSQYMKNGGKKCYFSRKKVSSSTGKVSRSRVVAVEANNTESSYEKRVVCEIESQSVEDECKAEEGISIDIDSSQRVKKGVRKSHVARDKVVRSTGKVLRRKAISMETSDIESSDAERLVCEPEYVEDECRTFEGSSIDIDKPPNVNKRERKSCVAPKKTVRLTGKVQQRNAVALVTSDMNSVIESHSLEEVPKVTLRARKYPIRKSTIRNVFVQDDLNDETDRSIVKSTRKNPCRKAAPNAVGFFKEPKHMEDVSILVDSENLEKKKKTKRADDKEKKPPKAFRSNRSHLSRKAVPVSVKYIDDQFTDNVEVVEASEVVESSVQCMESDATLDDISSKEPIANKRLINIRTRSRRKSSMGSIQSAHSLRSKTRLQELDSPSTLSETKISTLSDYDTTSLSSRPRRQAANLNPGFFSESKVKIETPPREKSRRKSNSTVSDILPKLEAKSREPKPKKAVASNSRKKLDLLTSSEVSCHANDHKGTFHINRKQPKRNMGLQTPFVSRHRLIIS
jgi:HMG (high mobility group) box/LysM domain